MSFWNNVDNGSETERRKAWQRFVTNNRRREIHVDGDVSISDLCDEINDAELSKMHKPPSDWLKDKARTVQAEQDSATD